MELDFQKILVIGGGVKIYMGIILTEEQAKDWQDILQIANEIRRLLDDGKYRHHDCGNKTLKRTNDGDKVTIKGDRKVSGK